MKSALIRKSIVEWILNETGLVAIPLYDSGPRPNLPYITYQIRNVNPVGVDSVSLPDENGAIRISGNRNFNLYLQCYGDTLTSDNINDFIYASDYLNILYTSLSKESTKDLFYTNNFVILDTIAGILDISTLMDTEYENRASADFICRTTTDISDTVELVDVVNIGATYKNVIDETEKIITIGE